MLLEFVSLKSSQGLDGLVLDVFQGKRHILQGNAPSEAAHEELLAGTKNEERAKREE